jgi:hypothetical protein
MAAPLPGLRRSQTAPERYQDHGGVAMAVAVGLGGLDQALDLALGQMLAGTQIGVLPPQWRLPLRDCRGAAPTSALPFL